MTQRASEAVDYSAYSPVDLLKMEVRTERQEEIPVGLIIQESALIDPEHAQNLAESMMGDRKQISPTTVRARLDNNQVIYEVIDGFHRSEGKRIIEQMTGEPQTMKTIVLYGCSDEELFDLRVLAASSVKSIKFARMAEWMKRSFLSTQWQNERLHELAEKEELTLSQVFNLAQFDSSGTHLRLNPEEVIELKAWANKKSKQWGRPLSTLMVEMRTVELAAPDLVQRVRTGGGGKGGKGVLTRARLEAIVTNLPGDWETQRLLADLAIARNILADDLDFLAWSFAQAKEAYDQETITKILAEPELLIYPQSVKNEVDDPKISEQAVLPSIPTREEYFQLKKRKRKQPKNIGLAAVEKSPVVVDETRVLKKHQVPEIIEALMQVVLADKGEDLTILNLVQGQLIMNRNTGVMRLNNLVVELTEREIELMTVFYLLEGMSISDRLLSLIHLNESRGNTREAVESLQIKLGELSIEAARELRIIRKGDYGWLVE